MPVREKPVDLRARDRFTGLKVWIEDHFNNSKNTARFQSAENFRESLHTIGNFPRTVTSTTQSKSFSGSIPSQWLRLQTHVCAACRFRLDLRPGKHSLAEYQAQTTIPANTLSQRNRETSGPTTGIQDLHSLGQAKSFNNKSSPVRFVNGLSKLHKPTQPYRAWKMPPIEATLHMIPVKATTATAKRITMDSCPITHSFHCPCTRSQKD